MSADTTLTHPNRVCQDASAAFVVALAAVIREGLDAEAAYARACAWDREHGDSPTITQALATARDAPPAYEHNQGHVLIALQNAFYQALHAATLEDGVVATVMGGGDTDTNAAIAGALLGGLHGARAVPAQWRQMVLTCRPWQGAPGVQQPRTQAFWPVDARCLAERLALAGTLIGGKGAGAGRDMAAQAESRLRSGRTDRMPLHLDGTPENTDWHSVGRERQHSGAARREAPGRERKGDGGLGAASMRAQPVPERTRFVGALLGGAMGDALGRPVEGMRPQDIRDDYDGRLTEYQKWPGWKEGPIGTVTDDTQMTMCVAECLTANGFLDPEDLARRFVAWLPRGRGKGRTTTEAVKRLRAGEPWYRAGDDSSGSGPADRTIGQHSACSLWETVS